MIVSQGESDNVEPLVSGLEPGPIAEDEITPEQFREGFGEDIQSTLDVDTWKTGEDIGEIYSRIQAEVRDAVVHEQSYRRAIRERVFSQLDAYPAAPKGAGVYPIYRDALQRVHRGLLINGATEACDGRLLAHDSLPLTIFQVGVSLVSYRGDQGTWSHRLFRRDLRVSGGDPAEEAIELLERREQRDALNHGGRRDLLARLARRGIMSYAERSILLRRSEAVWRMGHGNPAPFELLTGSGSLDLMIESTRLIRELIEGHQKFLFVASEPSDRLLLTIGGALKPLEYAIVRNFREVVAGIVDRAHYRTQRVTADTRWDGVHLTPYQWIRRFRDEVAPKVVVGVYRATAVAPPQVFYAHEDHADIAAHLAVADSLMQEHRGFPLLIDLADSVCRGVFGREVLDGPVASAYIDAGAPFQYISERQSRHE